MATAQELREDATAIWWAGVEAVRSDRLVRQAVHLHGRRLEICDQAFEWGRAGRLIVVGAGKAGAGMAAGLEAALGRAVVRERVTGWMNVPADCVRPLSRIHLHAARPAGLNEPTDQGVAGAREILQLVESAKHDDVCLVLLSGGGSALLPLPRPPVTLADKQIVTRFLMEAGATIRELNTVRKRLSLIKGGGLARACRAGSMITLIISDVAGDPLDVIASGPTVPDTSTDAEAREVLSRFEARPPQVPQSVWDCLERARESEPGAASPTAAPTVTHHVIGHNATAVEAAAAAAAARGYHVVSLGTDQNGEANSEGRALAQRCRTIRLAGDASPCPVCLVSGGEPVVRLVPSTLPRRGGRNQQLVLAALDELWTVGLARIVVLSGGTDGEDGPTDAAGAYADAPVAAAAAQLGLVPQPFLDVNNAYAFFERTSGLFKTGPTDTNVMDLRVALIGK